MKSRLFLKIFIVYSAILFIVITLDSFLVAYHARQDLSMQIKNELIMDGNVMALMPMEQLVNNIRRMAETMHVRITLVGAGGKVLADSESDYRQLESHIDRPEIQEARLKGQGNATRYSQTLNKNMMYVALPLREKGEFRGYVRLAKPLEEVKTAINRYYEIVFRTAVIVLTSFVLIALFFIPKLISPILKIKDYIETARKKDRPGSLIVHSRDEIGIIADNINMLVHEHGENLRLAVEERKKLESVFASMAEGIVILDRQGRIELANKSLLDILGDDYGDIRYKTPLEAFRNSELQKVLDNPLGAHKPVFKEIILGKDDPIFFNVTISPVTELPEKDRKTIMVFHDVTRLRKLARLRADFAVNVTHEIKTPLTAIIGFVQTLQEGAAEDQEKARRFLGTIYEHALRLNRLVDDLLTLSRIEIGEANLRIGRTDVLDSIHKAVAIIEEKAKEKGLPLRTVLPDELPPILADPDSVVQIMVNILDNAVKFTPSGNVAVSAMMDKEDVAVTIADTGIGIPHDDIPRLGERFFRVDRTRSREMGGTGLGLSIVKHLLKAQQGRMEVESKPGEGTVVKLFFPVFPAS
jgi:two-component system, OmpR family, phosphate regulon sensor histidine kinase PhoR